MLEVVEINAIEHLESLRLRWTALLYQTPGASLFQTLDWLQVYWRHAGAGHRLRVLVVQHRGTIIGILPLLRRREATTAGITTVLAYPGPSARHFTGLLGPHPSATLTAALRHLARQPRDWDCLSLAELGEHDRGRTANAMEIAGFFPRKRSVENITRVDLSTSWRPVSAGGGTDRGEIADVLPRDLLERVTFARVRPRGSCCDEDRSVERLVDRCFALDRSVRSTKITGGQSAAWLPEITTLATRLKMLDLNLLRLDGCLIGFSINVHFNGFVQQIGAGGCSDSIGFDPLSVLNLRMLQDSREQNDRCFEFAAANAGTHHIHGTQQAVATQHYYRRVMPFGRQLARFAKRLAPRWAAG